VQLSSGHWAIVGSTAATASSSGGPCRGISTWIFDGFEYISLWGEMCWNGSKVWKYNSGAVCIQNPFPPIGYCFGYRDGVTAPGWSSSIWGNFSVLNGGIPECIMPRLYDWGNGSSNSAWYDNWGHFC
jgi:hypothetical protein